MAAAFAGSNALVAGNLALSSKDNDDVAGTSGARPARKRGAAEPHSSKLAKKVSKTAEQEAKRHQKAIERAITKAQRELIRRQEVFKLQRRPVPAQLPHLIMSSLSSRTVFPLDMQSH